MPSDLHRLAAAAKEEAERGAIEGKQQRDQHPGHREVDRHAAVGDGGDPIPPMRANILRDHGADRGADGERGHLDIIPELQRRAIGGGRSEEHTSELQSLMRISYAVFCLKKKTTPKPSRS